MSPVQDSRYTPVGAVILRMTVAFVLLGSLPSCGRTWHEATHDYAGYSIQPTLVADSMMEAYLTPFRQQLSETMDDTLAEIHHTLTLEKPESTLGNFMADLLAEEATRITGKPVDLAIQNYGGIRRNSLAAGPFTLGMVYEIMPFDNQLVILELDGTGLNTLIDHMAQLGGWPVSKGVRYQIEDGQARAILVQNRPIQEEHTYRVALPDYIAKGGDRCDFLVEYPMIETGVLVRDALIHYCRSRQAAGILIDAGLDGRITQVD